MARKVAPVAKSKAKGGNGLVIAKTTNKAWGNDARKVEKTEWKRFTQHLEKDDKALFVADQRLWFKFCFEYVIWFSSIS